LVSSMGFVDSHRGGEFLKEFGRRRNHTTGGPCEKESKFSLPNGGPKKNIRREHLGGIFGDKHREKKKRGI